MSRNDKTRTTVRNRWGQRTPLECPTEVLDEGYLVDAEVNGGTYRSYAHKGILWITRNDGSRWRLIWVRPLTADEKIAYRPETACAFEGAGDDWMGTEI